MASDVEGPGRGSSARADQGHAGRKAVGRLLQLHDNLEATRGVQHPEVLRVRDLQTTEYWRLRDRLADLVGVRREGW